MDDDDNNSVEFFEATVLQLASCALDVASRSKRNGLVEEAAAWITSSFDDELDGEGDGEGFSDAAETRACRARLGKGGLGILAGEF